MRGSLKRSRLGEGSRAFLRCRGGNATIEFALVLPIFITLGMFGAEVANMAMVNMQVSQVAMAVADNASRLGQTDNSSITPTVSESEIESVLSGAMQQGSGLDLAGSGRIVLSSLERHPFSGRQYIHWQRCKGGLEKQSKYGPAGTGTDGDFDGMGRTGQKIQARNNTAVMYAEVFYEYQGLFGDMFVGNQMFQQEAAFEIRDDRNLTPGVTGTGGSSNCQS
ncbi:hypothetical protein GCM10011371_33180 [Novosphingobium marinum]|uniref:TadE-like domain-containing protein n=1 Tax=Novosphingobium marinum TaxID=1514948 RepID=A0A7Y9XYP2_9SPHN|nr:TadE/TadG family type IV pilus assembly protein [Novosphingobium marinum]NYH97044.1 hypothetical protein [Novosphingobium marinum]GGC43106.1 hypothetical protein GCM10011371_33180 [Novosphingobium marinum]